MVFDSRVWIRVRIFNLDLVLGLGLFGVRTVSPEGKVLVFVLVLWFGVQVLYFFKY